tara:strand:+ start:415 stop:708 length:294 start_codon:yes stop_codon:yes gene_type:complete
MINKRSPPTKARWKAIFQNEDGLFKKFYANADQIVDDLQSGLSKDIIYRKSRVSKGAWGYTGRKRVPHDHIKIIKLKIPVDFTDHNKIRQLCSIHDI